MKIDEYFDSVQEYIKTQIEDKTQVDSIVQQLDRDNIQAVINQDFNSGISVEESGDKMLKQMDFTSSASDIKDFNPLIGERGENTLERNIYTFSDFLINESKKEGKTIMVMTGTPKYDMLNIEPAKKRTKTTFALALSEFGYVQGRMNKDCDVLITNDLKSQSNKMEYAHKNDIEIVSYASLVKKYKLFT